MKQSLDRRDFLKFAGLAGPAALLAGPLVKTLAAAPSSSSSSSSKPAQASFPNADRLGWQLSCATYTFRRFGLYEALPKIASLGFHAVEPGFFLKLRDDQPALKTNESLSPEARAELKTKLAGYDIQMASFFSNLDGNEAENRKKLDFAKEMGAKIIVSEPPAEAFEMIDGLLGEYQITMAVHNHPHRPNSVYWNPETVLAACKGRSQRIGACCDIGHWVRSGLDPVECLKKLEGRIKSLHLKDVVEAGNPKAEDVPLGAGKAKMVAVLQEVHRQGFKGLMAIEYEHDSENLVADVAQCLAFVEKTAAML